MAQDRLAAISVCLSEGTKDIQWDLQKPVGMARKTGTSGTSVHQ